MVTIARIAMVLVLFVYASQAISVWINVFFGNGEFLFLFLQLPIPEIETIPMWLKIVGPLTGLATLLSLGLSFFAINVILRISSMDNFLLMSKYLRVCAGSLMVFCLNYNVELGVLPFILQWDENSLIGDIIHWLPFNEILVVFVLAIALFAISQVMRKAAKVDEENKLIL